MGKKKGAKYNVQQPKGNGRKGVIHCGTIKAEDIYKMQRPRMVPTSGFGVHGDVKYNRRKQKQEDRKLIEDDE